MAKFKGLIGFVKNVPTHEGSDVYEEVCIEKPYFFDIVRDYPKWDKTGDINDSVNINNKFSFVANSFAVENLGCMRYVAFKGFRWKITSAEILRPRIIIYIGGEYNG